MSRERRKFTREFKLEAVRLATTPGNKVAQVARDLGVYETTLRRWMHEEADLGSIAFPGSGVPALTSEQAEIKRLQRELETARLERDILKKAVAFFAKDQK